MALARFTFETRYDGNYQKTQIEGHSFTLALERARDKFEVPSVNCVALVLQERKEDIGWITIFVGPDFSRD